MKLPEASHPIWKIAQGIISIILVLVATGHGIEGDHTGGIDAADVAGAAGLLTGLHVVARSTGLIK